MKLFHDAVVLCQLITRIVLFALWGVDVQNLVRNFCFVQQITPTNLRIQTHEATSIPKKSGKEEDVCVSPAGDKRGGRSRLESTISGDTGQLSSQHGASCQGDSSVSPEKAFLGRRPHARRGDAGAAGAVERKRVFCVFFLPCVFLRD